MKEKNCYEVEVLTLNDILKVFRLSVKCHAEIVFYMLK